MLHSCCRRWWTATSVRFSLKYTTIIRPWWYIVVFTLRPFTVYVANFMRQLHAPMLHLFLLTPHTSFLASHPLIVR